MNTMIKKLTASVVFLAAFVMPVAAQDEQPNLDLRRGEGLTFQLDEPKSCCVWHIVRQP